jgi:hypothetical protein
LTGIDAVFVEEGKRAVARDERGQELSQVFGRELGVCAGGTMREGLQGGVGLEGNADVREKVKTFEEVGVEREAEICQVTDPGRVVGIGAGQHSGGGGGGFGKWGGPFQHGDMAAATVKFEGKGEADDAGPGDTDVGMVHGISLVCPRKGYSLCIGLQAEE